MKLDDSCCKNIARSFYRFVAMHAFDRRVQTDRRTDRQNAYRNTAAVYSCSAVKKLIDISLKTTRNYENRDTGSYCQASVHRPNVSFIHKQSIHRITLMILVITQCYLSSNKYNII